MWEIKRFRTKDAMNNFIIKNYLRIQWQEIFVDNGYAIEYRKLKKM